MSQNDCRIAEQRRFTICALAVAIYLDTSHGSALLAQRPLELNSAIDHSQSEAAGERFVQTGDRPRTVMRCEGSPGCRGVALPVLRRHRCW